MAPTMQHNPASSHDETTLSAPVGTIWPNMARLPNPYVVPVVTIPTAGALLGLSRRTAYRAAARGDLPTITVAGGRWVPTAALYGMLSIPLPATPAAPVVDH